VTVDRFSIDDFGSIPSAEALSHSWRPVNLVDLDLEPPVKPTISDIGYPGARHHLSGEPESLKTWLVLVLCHAEILIGNIVTYLDFENGARSMLGRLRDLGLDDDQIRAQFVYLQPDEPIGASGVIRDDLEKLLVGLRPSVCVLDSMAGALALHDLDPNSARDVEKFSQSVIDPLRSQGAATFTLDHVTKNRDTRGRFATGSERKVGVTDVHLGIEALQTFGRGRTGRAKIVVHKDRLGWLPRPKCAELEIVSNADTHQIRYVLTPSEVDQDAPTFRPTHLMEKVSRLLELYPGGLASRNAVDQGVTGKAEYIRLSVDVLCTEGYVVEEDGPRGARLYRSVRPFRESEIDLVPPRPDLVRDEVAVTPDDLVPPRPPLQEGRDEVGGIAHLEDDLDLVPGESA
jgi:hypothetical protein